MMSLCHGFIHLYCHYFSVVDSNTTTKQHIMLTWPNRGTTWLTFTITSWQTQQVFVHCLIIVRKNHNKRNENQSATIVQISCLLLCGIGIHLESITSQIEIEIKTTLASYNTHIKQQNKHIDVMYKHIASILFSLTCWRQKQTCVVLCLNFCSTKTKQ